MSYVADQAQRWNSGERVHNSTIWIGDNQHITFVDSLETTDTGAIKCFPFHECFLFKFAHGNAEMLPGPGQIYKFEVYHSSAVLFSELQYLFGGHAFYSPLNVCSCLIAGIKGLLCHKDISGYFVQEANIY